MQKRVISDHLLMTFLIFYFVCSSKPFGKMVKRLCIRLLGKNLIIISSHEKYKYMRILSVSNNQSGLSLLAPRFYYFVFSVYLCSFMFSLLHKNCASAPEKEGRKKSDLKRILTPKPMFHQETRLHWLSNANEIDTNNITLHEMYVPSASPNVGGPNMTYSPPTYIGLI